VGSGEYKNVIKKILMKDLPKLFQVVKKAFVKSDDSAEVSKLS
jgi:hypothetical protein